MGGFLRRILRWLDRLARAFFSIFIEEQDITEAQPPAEAGSEAAEHAILKPGELGIGSSEAPVYRKNKSLLTYREQDLYRAICAATNGEYAVMMKVRMGDFVWLRNEPRDRKFFNNQVLCKHVDFLLCDQNSLKPLLVIELDDSSHTKSGYTIDSDRFKDETFAAIGMPMLRVKVQFRYEIGRLREAIVAKLGEHAPKTA